MKLDSGAGTGYAERYRDVGSFASDITVVVIKTYFDTLDTDDRFSLSIFKAAQKLQVEFASDALYYVMEDAPNYFSLGDVVIVDTWQEWRFIINWATKTTDVYLDNAYVGTATNYTIGGTEGLIDLVQTGSVTPNRITYIDYIKIYEGTSGKTLTRTF